MGYVTVAFAGEHDLSLFDEVISIGSPGTEADSSPEPASPGLGQRGPAQCATVEASHSPPVGQSVGSVGCSAGFL